MNATHAPAAPLPGSVLAGKYRIDRVIGSGGMAVVVAATHRQLGESVAIKVLHPHIALRPNAIGRFLREARVAMHLRGEHVARVHDIGTAHDGAPFIVMELLEGADLGSLLRTHGPLSVTDAADYVLQVCEALAEAHAAGVVHRDLKPANLFLTTLVDGAPCVKVLDFGVSKVLEDSFDSDEHLSQTAPPSDPLAASRIESRPSLEPLEPEARATFTHGCIGSPRYMAPEQIVSARDVDARADVWALGVVMHELVSGLPPFRASTLAALRADILERPPAPLRARGRPLPALEATIGRCLTKDRGLRYPDVGAFAAALVAHASEAGRTSFARIQRIRAGGRLAPAPSPPPASPSPPPRRALRTMAAWAAVAIASSSACAALAVSIHRRDEARAPVPHVITASRRSATPSPPDPYPPTPR